MCPSGRSQDRPTFTTETNLQSIAVRVTDRQGRDIGGLTAADFSLFEDGHPEKISFFGAENQPVSLAVLVDSSASMRSGNKQVAVSEFLAALLHGNRPDDEIYFAPFTDRVYPFRLLIGEQRLHPPYRQVGGHEGTAFYDALSTAVCTLREASNLRQAVVVITDGADQNSRLTLDQLIHTAQTSRPQIFTVGFFDDREADVYRNSGKVVTLVNSHEIDNPLNAFERISKETGAESFFPQNQRDLEKALARILGTLKAQYTLAYYTDRPNAFRRIEVKLNNHPRAIVSARRTLGAKTSDGGIVHLSTGSCEVSASEYPYRWESHVEKTADGFIYRDDFSDSRSGWPDRPGLRYAAGGYELSASPSAKKIGVLPGHIAAYGPWFANFRASVNIESQRGEGYGGLAFRVNERGYYMLLLQNPPAAGSTITYKLVKTFWSGVPDETLVPWTVFHSKLGLASQPLTVAVECVGNRISIRLDGNDATGLNDDSFADGEVGMAFFGYGRALFDDLQVEAFK